jgi:O-antigen/teichoic acid export membrane protein
LLVSHLLNRLLFVGLLGVIGHRFGAEALGGYALASAIGVIFLFGADLGLSPRITREGAANPAELGRHFSESLGAKLSLAGLGIALFPLLYTLLPYPVWVRELCVLLAVAALLESFSFLNNAVCRSRQRMEFEAFAATTQAIVVVGGSLWVLLTGRPLQLLGWAAIAGSAAELALSAVVVRRFVPWRVARPRWEVLRAASPYAVASLNAASFFQVELLVLALIVEQVAVGQFASISRLLQGAGYLALLVAGAGLPALTVIHERRGSVAYRTAAAFVLWLGLLGGLAAAGLLVLLAEPIMTGVYGQGFAILAPLLRLGGLFLLLKCVSEALAVVLAASGGQGYAARSRVLGVLSSWVLFLVLTPPFGLRGALLALVLGELLVGLGQALRARDLLRPAQAATWEPRFTVSRPVGESAAEPGSRPPAG